MDIEFIQEEIKKRTKYELKSFDITNIKKLSNYNENLIIDLCQSIIGKTSDLKKLKDTAFMKQYLYSAEKNFMLPLEINELDDETKKELLKAHDIIIENCTQEAPEKINNVLLFKLYENYQKYMPFWAQIEYFKKVIHARIDINEINKHIHNEKKFKEKCREIYKNTMDKQDKILKLIKKDLD
jgi:hypothetical protein